MVAETFHLEKPNMVLGQLVFEYPQGFWPAMVLLVVLTLFTLWSYHGQSRGLAVIWRIGLPALRVLGMGAIAISILRPVISRPRFAGERAPVVVLLDNSQSMSVVDGSRSPAQWVGIAQAMNALPADLRDAEVELLQGECDRLSAQADQVLRTSADLDYARLSGRDIEAVRLRLDESISQLQATAHAAFGSASRLNRVNPLEKTLAYLERIPVGIDRQSWLEHIRDKARAAAVDAEQARLQSDGRLYRTNAAVREACGVLQSLSRIGLAQKMIQDPTSGLVARMGADIPVQIFTVSDRVTPVPVSNVFNIPADGVVTNLAGGIRAVTDSMQTAPPRAFVVFSDGRQVNADADSAALAGVPIYTVGVAARGGMKDFSIINLQIPSEVTVNEKVVVTAEIRGLGMKGTTARVTLSTGGGKETRDVLINDDRPIPLEFNVEFSQAGGERVVLEIMPVPGEISEQNNRVERWVNVTHSIHPNRRPATRPEAEAEWVDLTGDEGWLGHLAEASGGQFLRLDQVDQLPKKLKEIPEDRSRQVQIPLWDSSYFLCLVLGALTTEWGVRKRLGLV